MRKLLFAFALTFALAFLLPGRAHAQGYWNGYAGYDPGCTTVNGVSGCVSAQSACQSYANQDPPTYTALILEFVPIVHLNEYFTCAVGGNGTTYGIGNLALSCPAGSYTDPNSGPGCVQYADQVMPGKNLGGGGMCPLPATAPPCYDSGTNPNPTIMQFGTDS